MTYNIILVSGVQHDDLVFVVLFVSCWRRRMFIRMAFCVPESLGPTLKSPWCHLCFSLIWFFFTRFLVLFFLIPFLHFFTWWIFTYASDLSLGGPFSVKLSLILVKKKTQQQQLIISSTITQKHLAHIIIMRHRMSYSSKFNKFVFDCFFWLFRGWARIIDSHNYLNN